MIRILLSFLVLFGCVKTVLGTPSKVYKCVLTIEQKAKSLEEGRIYAHQEFDVDFPHVEEVPEFSEERIWKASELNFVTDTKHPELFDLITEIQSAHVVIQTQRQRTQGFEATLKLKSTELVAKSQGGSAYWGRPRSQGGDLYIPGAFHAYWVKAHAQAKTSSSCRVERPYIELLCRLKELPEEEMGD